MLIPTEWEEDDDGVKQRPDTDFEIVHQHPLHPYERKFPFRIGFEPEQIGDYGHQFGIMVHTVFAWEREIVEDLKQLGGLEGGIVIFVVGNTARLLFFFARFVRVKILKWLVRGSTQQ